MMTYFPLFSNRGRKQKRDRKGEIRLEGNFVYYTLSEMYGLGEKVEVKKY